MPRWLVADARPTCSGASLDIVVVPHGDCFAPEHCSIIQLNFLPSSLNRSGVLNMHLRVIEHQLLAGRVVAEDQLFVGMIWA